MKASQILCAFAACLISFSSAAQWQWIDKDGRKVFSDRPPPSDVPDKNILKQPSARAKSAADAPAATTAAAAPSPVTAKLGDGLDKGLMEKKKQAEAAEAAKRKAEEDRIASAKADSCARARQAKIGLDSGVRISRVNEKGEREFLDDAARAAEAQRTQAVIDSDCR